MGIRIGRVDYFLEVATTVALRADCVRAAVGAVIVDQYGRIASTGYNGAPAGHPGCLSNGACPRANTDTPPGSSYDNCISVHAEANAIIYGDYERMRGGTLFSTREPCNWCRKLIQGAGIDTVVYPGATGRPEIERA